MESNLRLAGYPLTRQQRDGDAGLELVYWLITDTGPQEVVIRGTEAVCFVEQSDQSRITLILADLPGWQLRPLKLQSLNKTPVMGLYCSHLQGYREVIARLQAHGLALMEEDIRPVDRYLMERFIRTGAAAIHTAGAAELRPCQYTPRLKVCSLDIETTLSANRILSIALQMGNREIVLINGRAPDQSWIIGCASEVELLRRFQQVIRDWDPDILIGWALIAFDLKVLHKRAKVLQVPLLIGRDQDPLYVEQGQNGRWFARMAGRIALDGIETLKGATWQFERYSLEFVSRALLGRGKIIDDPNDRGEEIQRLYAEDRLALARYNLEDCRLVSDIFGTAGLIDYLLERARLTGLALDRVGGSQQAFDNLYLPRLHRKGYVAPRYASGRDDLSVPGGFVMESQPGLYRNVLVFDFKSLYPSIIRTFSIDPLGLALADEAAAAPPVPGFFGAQFNASESILPTIIAELWQARDQAKADGNAALSQAIKIQMNACYGVLGSRVCRFFDQRLSASITLRGHELLNGTAEYIRSHFGHQVIYGDTDSVFVWLGDDWQNPDTAQYGRWMADQINAWLRADLQHRFAIDSALEIQFESEFSRFLMPTMRHSERGTKKRYAGLKRQGEDQQLVFKGLESVRSDWTAAARSFQTELYSRVFHDQPWKQYLRDYRQRLISGEMDQALLYRRRLRRPLEAYQASNPPHVKAARKLQSYLRARSLPSDLGSGDTIEYWITVNGPEPRICASSQIDYQHYIDKQLRPVADSLLPFLGSGFDQLVAPQIELF